LAAKVANDGLVFRPSIALVNHHEGFMTLFATSHTAKTLKMKATACRKEGIK